MHRDLLLNLVVAAVMTVVIALAVGPGWAAWLIGAVYALTLAVGVWIGSGATVSEWALRPVTYAAGAVVALAVGGATWWMAGADNGSFWGVGVVLGIVLSGSLTTARAR